MCSKRGWWWHIHAKQLRSHTHTHSHANVSIFFPNFIGKNKIPNFWKNAYRERERGREWNGSRLSSNKIIALRTHTPYHTPFFCANNAWNKQSRLTCVCVCTINALNKYFSEKRNWIAKGNGENYIYTHREQEPSDVCMNYMQCSAALLKFTISKNVKITPKISENSMFLSASVSLSLCVHIRVRFCLCLCFGNDIVDKHKNMIMSVVSWMSTAVRSNQLSFMQSAIGFFFSPALAQLGFSKWVHINLNHKLKILSIKMRGF